MDDYSQVSAYNDLSETGKTAPRAELGSHTVRAAKRTDIFSLSFGHSLSPLSYSKSKLTLLHSNAAPAPPPNIHKCHQTNKTIHEGLLLLVLSDEF